MPTKQIIAISSLLLLLTSCSAFRFPGVFKIDINQGNLVTEEMINKLKPGMSRNQVLFVMGSPQLTDTFHHNRWDYYLSYRHGGKDPEVRHITLFFDNDQFTHYTGEVGELLTFEKKLRGGSNDAKDPDKSDEQADQDDS